VIYRTVWTLINGETDQPVDVETQMILQTLDAIEQIRARRIPPRVALEIEGDPASCERIFEEYRARFSVRAKVG
jgi:hypothetical protein